MGLAGDRTNVHDVGTQVTAAVNEHSDPWTAHKAETGVVYYYNALTGESTYNKPPDFWGQVFMIVLIFFHYYLSLSLIFMRYSTLIVLETLYKYLLSFNLRSTLTYV